MSVEKYLARYADVDAQVIARVTGNYRGSLVVPVFDERPEALEALLAAVPEDTLAIIVVNAPDDAPATEIEATRDLLRHLRASKRANLACIDRVSDARTLPSREGVGLARKIGTDTALALRASGVVNGDWIWQTDADVVLPEGYFDITNAAHPPGVLVLAHQHVSPDPIIQYAADLYDQHMAYYIAGLAAAGSPYAYATIGSTLVVHADSYASVRGYPRRNAGEDFYLLNKLAKVSTVTSLDGPTIELEARLSHRVPFGTGPALRHICALLAETPDGSTYLSYDPNTFRLMKQALDALQTYAATAQLPPGPIAELLSAIGFDRVCENIAARFDAGHRRHKALTDWFDAFRTMRFIHEARRYHPDTPLLATLADLPSDFSAWLST